MTFVINKEGHEYKNLIIMVDFDADINSSVSDGSNIESFRDDFHLANLIHSETCFKKNS